MVVAEQSWLLPAGDDGCVDRGNRHIGETQAISDDIPIPPLPPIDEAKLEATLTEIADSRGYVSNLMQILALAPDGLKPFAALGDYCRFGTMLTELQRELVIIVAIRDVHYGWTHHEPLARNAGLTDEQLLLIRDGRTPRSLAPAEYALCDYAFEITAGRRIPPRVAEALHMHFNARQIVDIALLTSYYMAVAALAIGLEVSVEGPDALKVEQDRQRARILAARLSPEA